jgi:hypothetical protein
MAGSDHSRRSRPHPLAYAHLRNVLQKSICCLTYGLADGIIFFALPRRGILVRQSPQAGIAILSLPVSVGSKIVLQHIPPVCGQSSAARRSGAVVPCGHHDESDAALEGSSAPSPLECPMHHLLDSLSCFSPQGRHRRCAPAPHVRLGVSVARSAAVRNHREGEDSDDGLRIRPTHGSRDGRSLHGVRRSSDHGGRWRLPGPCEDAARRPCVRSAHSAGFARRQGAVRALRRGRRPKPGRAARDRHLRADRAARSAFGDQEHRRK